MSKKMKWILILAIAATALVFLLLPTNDEVVVRVPLPLERVMAEFETPEKAKKWYDHIDSLGYKLTIEKANPFEFIFVHQKVDEPVALHFVVSPDTTDSKLTKIVFRYRDAFFKRDADKLKKKAAEALGRLGDSLVSTKYVYGYTIRETTVTDSSFLFQRKIVKRSEEQAATKMLFDELLTYAGKRDAGYNGIRIFYSQPMPDDKIALYGSVGVNNYTPTAVEEQIQYKMMPYGKKLLVMDFEGLYGKTKDLYAILEEYKRNNSLVSMAIPFQKFLTEGYGFADSLVVKTRISYPVF